MKPRTGFESKEIRLIVPVNAYVQSECLNTKTLSRIYDQLCTRYKENIEQNIQKSNEEKQNDGLFRFEH